MLQRLLAVSALLATAASVSEALQVHVRLHHKSHHARQADGNTTAPAATSAAPSAAGNSSSGAWSFTPVKSIQARVQGDAPKWDAATKTWIASFGKTYEQQFRSVLDTVNTASVEGALMYVQAEGINSNEQSVKCERKNKMQYVVFYEVTVAQPSASVAFYGGKHSTAEYCPFVAMDGGKCTPAGEDYPDTCKQYDGIGGQPKLGHCVGANEQVSDKRAPYPGNYWFSYPNSCVTKGWSDKTDECRKEFPGGLCEPSATPDGVTCSYNYKILGYLNIDDLVGITDGTAAKDGKAYANFTEFCKAGNVEFAAENTGSGFTVEQSIDFWKNPGDESANEERTEKMIEKYNQLAPKATVGVMTALPEIDDLAKANPPCYKNAPQCATATNGCHRVLYSQLCEVCDSKEDDCVTAPSGYKFPTLEVPKATSDESSEEGSGEDASSGSGKRPKTHAGEVLSNDDVLKSSVGSVVVSTAAVALSAVAAALL